jgi:hypothetical protein
MTQLVCIRPIGDHKPGDRAEVPDGATWSRLYYTEARDAEGYSDEYGDYDDTKDAK